MCEQKIFVELNWNIMTSSNATCYKQKERGTRDSKREDLSKEETLDAMTQGQGCVNRRCSRLREEHMHRLRDRCVAATSQAVPWKGPICKKASKMPKELRNGRMRQTNSVCWWRVFSWGTHRQKHGLGQLQDRGISHGYPQTQILYTRGREGTYSKDTMKGHCPEQTRLLCVS